MENNLNAAENGRTLTNQRLKLSVLILSFQTSVLTNVQRALMKSSFGSPIEAPLSEDVK